MINPKNDAGRGENTTPGMPGNPPSVYSDTVKLPAVVSNDDSSCVKEIEIKTSVKSIIHKIEHNIHSSNNSLDEGPEGLESNVDVMAVDSDEIELSGDSALEGEVPSMTSPDSPA